MNEVRTTTQPPICGILYDPQRDRAILEREGLPLGSTFSGFAQGAIRVTANEVAQWFRFGMTLAGLDLQELAHMPRDFARVKSQTTNLLGAAAWSASRCGLTEPKYVKVFFEAALRGQLHDYELAIYRLRPLAGSTSAAADRLNPLLPGWSWQVCAALPDALQQEAGPSAKPTMRN
jgi:hypothetical protein